MYLQQSAGMCRKTKISFLIFSRAVLPPVIKKRDTIYKKVMSKNLTIKIILLILLVFAGIFFLFAGVVSTIYIAGKTRMWIQTRDMTGGTSLVYEVDTQGLTVEEKKGLSKRMIRILRRRVDPTGFRDLVWRPLGDTRFEIRMPLASKETRQRRQNYEKALSALLAKNINRAMIMR